MLLSRRKQTEWTEVSSRLRNSRVGVKEGARRGLYDQGVGKTLVSPNLTAIPMGVNHII